MTNKAYDYMTFGDRIAYARHKRGLSQEQLAKLIGTTQAKVACWETGKRNFNMYMLRKVTAALEVPEDWLTGNDDNFKIKNSTEIKLTLKQQQLVADNANVIAVVYKKFFKYNTMLRYEEVYGDASIALCKAAKIYDEGNNYNSTFFTFAFSYIKHVIFHIIEKKATVYRHNISINKIIGQDDMGKNIELLDIIPAPDEWEQLKYKILADSVYQKVEPVLTANEREAFRPWLHGGEVFEIARATGINQNTLRTRIRNARIKCRDCFNPDEIFA